MAIQIKKSTRNRILYDFNDNSKYSTYEKDISSKIRDTNYKISSLYDYPTIMQYMRKLFEGNVTVQFGTSYAIAGCIRDKGTYTIIKENGRWGYLKSGAGWICLDYTIRR